MRNNPQSHPGNKFAAKPESEKVSGKGRIVVDLGELKAAVVASPKRDGRSLKACVVEALESWLRPHE